MLMCIGDVHGRLFWKDAVDKHAEECDKIIFLGDYCDPYPWEGITRKDAIRNLQEIIDFKKENKEKVELLLGNHDLPYVDKRNFTIRSRYDSSNARKIEEMFNSHRSFFKLAHEEFVADKRYLFTHSGLIPEWYEDNKNIIGELTVDNLNLLLRTPNGINALCDVSPYRGGWGQHGSIVWGDVRDMHEGINENIPWEYQIFGHTQLEDTPIIEKEFACIDCRKAFILTNEGKIEEAN